MTKLNRFSPGCPCCGCQVEALLIITCNVDRLLDDDYNIVLNDNVICSVPSQGSGDCSSSAYGGWCSTDDSIRPDTITDLHGLADGISGFWHPRISECCEEGLADDDWTYSTIAEDDWQDEGNILKFIDTREVLCGTRTYGITSSSVSVFLMSRDLATEGNWRICKTLFCDVAFSWMAVWTHTRPQQCYVGGGSYLTFDYPQGAYLV